MSTATPAFSLDEFQRTLIYQREATPAEVQSDMQQLLSLDKAMEVEEAKWRKRTTALGCTTALMLFGTIAGSVVGGPVLGVLAGLIFIGLLVSAIVSGSNLSKYSRLNLENRRYASVAAILKYVGRDMAPDAPVSVRIDFNSYLDARFVSSSSPAGLFGSVSSKSFKVPWLALSGKLIDGSRFDLSALILGKRKEKRKRKYTKVREGFRERVALSLAVKAAKYPTLAELPARLQATNPPTPFQPMGIRVDGNVIQLIGTTNPHNRLFGRGQTVVKTAPSESFSKLDDFLQLFLLAYHGLELCRE